MKVYIVSIQTGVENGPSTRTEIIGVYDSMTKAVLASGERKNKPLEFRYYDIGNPRIDEKEVS